MSRTQRKEMTRELLLDAAIDVFAEKGYDGASLDDVADAAGFTKGAVYSNFTRKSDLFRALLEREASRYDQAIALFEKASALPESQWPRMHEEDDVDAYLKQQKRLIIEIMIARTLTRLRQYDRLDAHIEKFDAQLHNGKTFDKLRPQVWSNVGWRARIAEEMIEAGDLDRAEQVLRKIEERRPDFRALENMQVRQQTVTGTSGFNPRQRAVRMWDNVDIAWWKLKKARKQQAK